MQGVVGFDSHPAHVRTVFEVIVLTFIGVVVLNIIAMLIYALVTFWMTTFR